MRAQRTPRKPSRGASNIGIDMKYRVSTGTILLALAVVLKLANLPTPGFAQESGTTKLYQQARVYEHAQNYAAAEEVYRKLLAAHPDDPRALKRLGIVEQTELKFDDSIALFRRVLHEHPEYPQVNFFLGLSYYGLHDYNGAIASFQKELKTPTAYQGTRYYFALALEAEGRDDEAIDQLNQVAAQKPNDANVLYELARLHMDASFHAIQKLRQLHPDSFQIHAFLGGLYENEGQYSAAVTEYEAALKKQPDATGIHYPLGVAYWMLRQLGLSEKEFLLALKESPRDAQVEIYLANIALLQQQFGKARDYLIQAKGRQPQDEQIHLLLGRCYLGLDEFQQAKAEFLFAVHLNPTGPRSHYFLSQAYRKLHEPADAQRELTLSNRLSSTQRAKSPAAARGPAGSQPRNP